jgi:integrase/recombinase XerC
VNKLVDSFIEYLQYERNYSVCTVVSYTKDIEQFEAFVNDETGGPFAPEGIDSDIVRNWIVFLLDNKMAPTSVNRKLSSLKSFFKFLVRRGIVSTNPLRLVVGPKTGKPLPNFVREAELDRLLDGDGFGEDFEGVRNRLVIEMLYDTGLRRSELIGIKNVDVNYETSLLRVTGKRNKQRLIPFAEGLKTKMLAYVDIRDSEIGENSEWLFIRKNGEPLSAAMVYNIVKKSLSEIPALSKRSPHVLRHSFATSMLNNGAELNAVKEFLGHSSLASTGIYTHTTFEELKKVYHAHPRAKKEGGFYGH